jgi:hypothetical protein
MGRGLDDEHRINWLRPTASEFLRVTLDMHAMPHVLAPMRHVALLPAKSGKDLPMQFIDGGRG